MNKLKLTVKCAGCGIEKELTDSEISQAREAGCTLCEKCGMPMLSKRAVLISEGLQQVGFIGKRG